MKSVREAETPGSPTQFGLPSLLEFVTLCAVISAFSAILGVAASMLLMLMAMALWARQGLLALGLLMVASLAADGMSYPLAPGLSVTRQLVIIVLAAALCGWYRLRRKYV